MRDVDWLRNNSLSTVKNQSNTVLQKEDDNSSENKLKVMEDYDATDTEFKIVVIKKTQLAVRKLRKAVQ